MVKSKDPIRLRRRKTPTGLVSLYLDIYIDGKRSYEYLKMYLVPEKGKAERDKNRETLALAEAIRGKRLVELRDGVFGFKGQFRESSLFYDYYCAMVEKRVGSPGNWGNWHSCLKHLEKYDPKIRQRKWSEVTHEYCQGFKDYLENEACAWSQDYRKRIKDHKMARNTRLSYFNKLRACCNQAFEERVISVNPMRGIDTIKAEEGTRMYLTLEEVRKLAATECHYDSIKKAFLFSCLTGLRRSDIMKLTWGEVFQQGGYTRIIFTQKKTQGVEYLDLAPEAAELLGTRGKPTEHVFEDIHSPSCTNSTLREWCMDAGINKRITFHCGRHTFATMMLDLGTDIYTVSKLLGHRELSTTQIYAKVLDKNKQAAVSSIPSIFKPEEKGEGGKEG